MASRQQQRHTSGDLLTGGYNHDHPRVQQAWSEQEQLGRSIVNMILSPRQATSQAIESVVNRYNAAMALSDPYEQSRALGQFFNDVGQSAAGLGYPSAALVRPAARVATTIGENAFTGPVAGSRRAQLGAVGELGNNPIPPIALTSTEVRELVNRSATKHGDSGQAYNVGSQAELHALYAQLTVGSNPVPASGYAGTMRILPDGTRIGLRLESTTGGHTIDVHKPSGKPYRIHINPLQPP